MLHPVGLSEKLVDLAGYFSLFGKNHSCLPYTEHLLVFVNSKLGVLPNKLNNLPEWLVLEINAIGCSKVYLFCNN